jgi:hypothetical protein
MTLGDVLIGDFLPSDTRLLFPAPWRAKTPPFDAPILAVKILGSLLR